MLCHASINCENLEHFLRRISKFSTIVNSNFDLRLVRDADCARFCITINEGQAYAPDHIIMLVLAISHRLACWAIDQKIELASAQLSCEQPYYADDYNLLLSAPVLFDQKKNFIEFHADYLDAEIQQDEQSLRGFLANSAFRLMSELELDSSLSSQIRHMIRKDNQNNFHTFEEVARSLNFTTATLRRRLRSEGVTYQDIKDAIRRDTAIYYLSRKNMNLDEVARHAGFSETASFYRAFKRWTGTSPRSYVSAQ